MRIISLCYEIINQGYEIISHCYEIISQRYERISQCYEMLSQCYEIISQGYEIISQCYEMISQCYELISQILIIQSFLYSPHVSSTDRYRFQGAGARVRYVYFGVPCGSKWPITAYRLRNVDHFSLTLQPPSQHGPPRLPTAPPFLRSSWDVSRSPLTLCVFIRTVCVCVFIHS